MSTDPRHTPPETPRSEPEILPPARPGERPPEGRVWAQWPGAGTTRIRIVRIGPFRLFLWAMAALIILAGVLFVFAGALLIAIPAIAAIVAGSFLAAWFRRTFRR